MRRLTLATSSRQSTRRGQARQATTCSCNLTILSTEAAIERVLVLGRHRVVLYMDLQDGQDYQRGFAVVDSCVYCVADGSVSVAVGVRGRAPAATAGGAYAEDVAGFHVQGFLAGQADFLIAAA